MGIFLTFSGLGVGLGPDSWGNSFLMLGIIMLYSLFVFIYFFAWQMEIETTENFGKFGRA